METNGVITYNKAMVKDRCPQPHAIVAPLCQTTNKSVPTTTPVNEFVVAGILMALTTGFCLLIVSFIGYQAVALVYLLLVVALAIRFSRGPALTLAASSAVLWNFLFVPPHHTLYINDFHDGMMFLTFFVVAITIGHLTTRLRRNEMGEREREQRTAALYELARQAAFATDLDSGLKAAVGLIEPIFSAKVGLLLRQKDHTLSSMPHAASSFTPSEKEKRAAAWAFNHRLPAGRFTDAMPDSEALHVPLQGRTAVMGVLSLCPRAEKSLDPTERDLLEAFAVLIGLVLEKEHVIEALKHAEILEASEHLRRALLESVSHELKTPLSAVQAGIDALARQTDGNERRQSILREVQLAVRRLHRVINNLLNMTRIESGVIQPGLDWCDVGEIVHAAIELAGESVGDHQVIIEVDQTLPMVKVDQPLLEQCLCNLLLNSAANSPPATKITIRARVQEERLVLSVLDEGKGIRKEDLTRIFEVFYRGADASPGGTGLGLAIVDGFVRAHGGSVRAANRETGGAEFVITIPVETFRTELREASP
ncbi:MAG TPA: ATP-binding protein [Candidatus Binatia bacterium]|nr:ATP-binding protein [Candidatus Binatia bacterium]